MVDFKLRKATYKDNAAIRRLIRRVNINPFQLDWQRFIIAEDENGQFLGCGQIKAHGDGSFELASLAVQPECQDQGIGRAILLELLSTAPHPLYLTCRAPLQPYYEKFGFRLARREELPPYFRRIWSIFWILKRLFPGSVQGRVMIHL